MLLSEMINNPINQIILLMFAHLEVKKKYLQHNNTFFFLSLVKFFFTFFLILGLKSF